MEIRLPWFKNLLEDGVLFRTRFLIVNESYEKRWLKIWQKPLNQ